MDAADAAPVGRRHLLRATGVLGAVMALGTNEVRRRTPLVPPASATGTGVEAAAATPTQPSPPPVPAPAIVPFTEWSSSPCPTPTDEGRSPVERLVVHHTYEPVADTPDEVLWALDTICDIHTERGFDSIGYHYLVDPWGQIWQGRGGLPDADGRPPAEQPEGAHVAGSNPGAVGVAFLGDHKSEPPTDAALDAATHLLAWLLQPTGLGPDERVAARSTGRGTARFTGVFHPRAIAGHAASNRTECPGRYLEGLLGRIREDVDRWLSGDDPVTARREA